jgi:serine phosphatase RsbU (regulator of sigma subunit)
MTLLVVDDREPMRSLAGELSSRGFAVERAAVSSVRERALRERPALVFGALDVVEALSQDAPNLPLAVYSAEPLDKRNVVRALRFGAIDVIEAGEASHLSSIVEAAIERAQQRVSMADPASHSAEAKLRELQRDQRAGRYIQMGMLPPTPMAVDDYRLRHRILPSLMLSGDFVDYFRIGDRHFVFYVADVSGHGASSAFVTVLLKNFSRRLRREYRPAMLSAPGEILGWLNRELLDNKIDKHVAMFIGVVDVKRNRLAYANAGHFPPAMLVDHDGARMIEIVGKPVGLFHDASWESAAVELADRFSLIVVSDGVLETMGQASLADKERQLLDAALGCHATNREIWEVLELESDRPAPDDIACLMITRGVA